MNEIKQCPYPEFITDEASGLEVKNDLYRAWGELIKCLKQGKPPKC